MIISFSGTGNSTYVATEIASLLNEPHIRLTDQSPADIKFSGMSLGFVFPVYSWGLPPIVLDYIRNLNPDFIKKASECPVWGICVCGDETAYAPRMLRDALKKIGLRLAAVWSVQMPNNYVLLPGFDVDPVETERKKIAEAPARIKEIAMQIKNRKWADNCVIGSMPWIKSRIIYPLFKKWGIFPSKWMATDACVSCGLCVKACPVNNITIKPGEKPVWGDNCTSCLGCYHTCPRHAVNYGRATLHKGQYHFPANFKK